MRSGISPYFCRRVKSALKYQSSVKYTHLKMIILDSSYILLLKNKTNPAKQTGNQKDCSDRQRQVHFFYFFLTADRKYTTEHHDLIFIMRLINKNTKKSTTKTIYC